MRATPDRSLGAALLIGWLAVTAAVAADWPQFRGPHRDGTVETDGLRETWPGAGPPVVWRVPLGDGYSGLAVVGERLFTMYGSKGDELATAIDAGTGETIWTFRVDGYRKDGQGGGPRSTPTVAGGLVYVLGARGKLHALSIEDGKPAWSHDLVAEYDASIPRWGAATAPLVDGERLIVNVGGAKGASVVAFDRSSGEEVWRSYDDAAGYSAPIAVTVDGVRQIVVFTATHLVALAADDGAVLWEIPWETAYDVNAATPLFVPPDRVFVSSGYDVGAALWRIQSKGGKLRTKAVWKNREMKNQFSSSVLVDGHLYGFDDATLKCLDAGTGERRWRERGLGHGSLIYADDRLYVLGERGTLVLLEASPEAYRERGRMELFEGKTWTPPSLAGGRLFVRDQRELVALDVTE